MKLEVGITHSYNGDQLPKESISSEPEIKIDLLAMDQENCDGIIVYMISCIFTFMHFLIYISVLSISIGYSEKSQILFST